MFPEDERIVSIVREVLLKKGWIDLPSHGTSMYPLIKEGDICRFSSCNPSELKKRDVILFSTPSNSFVAHRLIQMDNTRVICKGDGNLGFDPPIEQTHILGKLMYIKRNDKNIHLDNFSLKVWGHFVQSVPVVSTVIRLYLKHKTAARFGVM
ncbi:signal peptidase [Bacillus tianshenii]|uniref:Signal peptidase n=1 Tax=Sutcliffiella tianshenii TaxID=1463404 RepID=A0ABS2NUH9_9BACI|nr:hypothetical protein [Bacillus tianshenii]MBM7618247.1 signal peptidase [Bacillus tianshenii]